MKFDSITTRLADTLRKVAPEASVLKDYDELLQAYDNPDSKNTAWQEMARKGRTIEAISICRATYSFGLRESRDFVLQCCEENNVKTSLFNT